MLAVSILGSIVGAVVLLRTSNAAFTQLIPALPFFSTLLFIIGPGLTRGVRAKRTGTSVASPTRLIPFVIARAIAWDAVLVACTCAIAGGYSERPW